MIKKGVIIITAIIIIGGFFIETKPRTFYKKIESKISYMVINFFESEIFAQQESPAGILDSVQRSKWYVNSVFRFRIKKIEGWQFKIIRGPGEDVPVLNLAFVKDSVDGDFKNMVIINVSKLKKPGNYETMEDFVSQADEMIQSETKNLKGLNFIQHPKTVYINSLEARVAIFEWEDQQGGNEKLTNTLIIFAPVAISYDLLSASLLFKCKSKEYPILRNEVDAAVTSIKIGE
jgi:hypothetical protein